MLLICFLSLASLVSKETPCQARFPMAVLADHRADGTGLDFALLADESSALASSERVSMTGVPLPDGSLVELDLRKIVLDDSELVVRVDGVPARQDDGGSVMLAGRIAGAADSDVYLAFSTLGSRGWIRRGSETFHLLAMPGEARDWSRSTSLLVSESTLLAHGARPPGCATDELVVPGRGLFPPRAGSPRGGSSMLTLTTLTYRMALETDYQLFQDFGNNLAAEQAYVTQLFAAGSARYVEQVNTVLQRVYIAYYTNPSDPWTSQDIGGSSIDLLYEFQGAWAGNLPNGANLANFLSGADLGGGVAWLDVLCDPTYGFAVSGNITRVTGLTQFPVVQGPSNWDFMVFTHETGHNFGTPHTHDFCPPIDQCAPPGYFGNCQTQQVCITNGTLMSYCHLCPNGLSNIYPYFAPECVTIMRQRAEASCIGPWCTGPTSYCPATFNTTGLPGALAGTGSSSIAANTFTLTASQLPANKTVLFFYGDTQVQVAQGQGFRCVGGNVFRLLPALNSGPGGSVSRLLDFAHPPAGSGPGKIEPETLWNFQAYYRDPAGGGGLYNLTEALAVPFCP
jgi:hypothetical protein